jgi:hypothetical protein
MPGRWILCGQESAFDVDGGDVGLEITTDHLWYKLYEAPGGATVRGSAANERGSWSTVGDAGQVNFDLSSGGTVITAPVFASSPKAMHLDNNGVYRGNYVIDPSFPTGSVRCAPQPDPTRSGSCTPPPASLEQETPCLSTAEFIGQWSRCGGSMPGAPPHDGIEFAADGSFYFLHRDAMGALVRGTSNTDTGTVQIDSVTRCGEADVFLTTGNGAAIGSAADIYLSTPRQLWIITGPEWGDPDRYTFVTP